MCSCSMPARAIHSCGSDAMTPDVQSYATPEAHFSTLGRAIPNQADADLARRHAPLIRFDAREPFLPQAVGYTVFRSDGRSPSFPRDIALPSGAAAVIEYAIWWDWDIGHLYELEHIWVAVNADDVVVDASASWHGGMHAMRDASGQIPLDGGRVAVFSESGKHAFAPVEGWLLERRPTTDANCTRDAGKGGVLITPLFEGVITARTPLHNNVVHAWLERRAFTPSYAYTQRFDLASAPFVPWESLRQWIPGRVQWWADYLRETTPPAQRRPLRIAHRGASAYAQEGSQASVEKAAELGADMVEADLRVTADDALVIAHDASLKRLYGIDSHISEMTWAELRAATPPNRQPVLALDEMLRLCLRLGLGLYLDIKEVTPASMATLIETLRPASHAVIFSSFRPDVAAEIKAAFPAAVTSILFSSTHIDPVALARAAHADYVHPCWERFASPAELLTPEWMRRVREAGLGIICWHEERPEVISALHALGVDGICSDRPELLRR